MDSARAETLLELASELERRDDAVAAEVDAVATLAAHADGIARRAAELDDLLGRAPAELAAADREAAAARDALAAAGERLRAVVAEQAGDEARERARALEAVAELELRAARAGGRRDGLAEAERAARAEIPELAAAAARVACELGRVPQVSASGRVPPGSTLAGLEDWARRVQAALFVVRGQLERERERIVREAAELGAAVLGEPVGGASVRGVRLRVEAALRA